MNKFFIVCNPPPFFWRESWASNQIFKKGELDMISTFRGGLLGKRGDDFFKKFSYDFFLKSKKFNDKKSL